MKGHTMRFAIFSLAAFVSGCAQIPERIGAYRLEKSAAQVFKTYSEHVLQDDLNKLADKVFSMVDVNTDGVIQHGEAYDAIGLIRPYQEKFFTEAMTMPDISRPIELPMEVVKTASAD
jgi:hypothetical protein